MTERGYGIVELTERDVTVGWWFVHPYDARVDVDDSPGAAFRSTRAAWPPRFERIELERHDPDRPGLPDPLPDRPADLRRLRVRRRLRIAAESTALTALLLAPVAWLAHRWRARRA